MRTDLYNILGVSTDASQQEIKAAMFELGKKYAVRSQIDHSAHVRFNQIKEAYVVISNPYRRANYDNFLQQNEEIRNNSVIFSIADTKIYC
ncbi:MAG: DnaJ domain-containing protein, partial [Proteobacteria bacterium]|nr:DnaJ domain-containing protein [Pseudomonadota bacterium]